MRKLKKSKSSTAVSETASHLKKVLDEFTAEDSIGFLNAVDEFIQEIETNIQLLDYASEEVTDEVTVEGFHPATAAPAQFTSEPSGHLVTTEQVNNALRRDESDRYQEDATAEEEAVKRVAMPRLRRPKKMEEEVDEEAEEEEEKEKVVGIFGTSMKPSKWSLSHYLQSVASTREKRVVALSAWMLALIGLIVALVFVTRDFIDSQREMASTIRYTDSERLALPSIWLCQTDTQLPPFLEQPNERYTGSPFMWLDLFAGSTEEIDLTYPRTKQLTQLEDIKVNVLGQPCNRLQAMDPAIFERENLERPQCYHCIAIKRDPEIILENIKREEEKKAGSEHANTTEVNNENYNHAALRVSMNSILSRCRQSQLGLNRDTFYFFVSIMKENHDVLASEGILDFDGVDALDSTNDQYLWPLYRMGYRNATLDLAVFDVVDMFCNVYLFSGHFYPSTSKDIKFKFNSLYYRWERIGKGPYYPAIYSNYYNPISNSVALISSDIAGIGQEKYDNVSMFVGRSLQVMTNESRSGVAENVATLEPSRMVGVRFIRSEVNGRESFSAHVSRARLREGDVRSVNFVYYLDLSFNSFLTRMVSDQLTVSWSAFVADFFGLTSLFLDVSVYTLIVSPLIMRARKNALLARKMRRTGPEAV